MRFNRLVLANIPFFLICVLSLSPSCSFGQVVGMETSVIQPNYRDMILPGAPSPEIRVEVALLDLNGLALDELEVVGELKINDDTVAQKSYKPPPSNPFNVELDVSPDLPAGSYTLSIGVYQNGNPVEEPDVYLLEKLSQEPASYIDYYNRFILKGKPFFPLGLYVVQCTNGTYSAQLAEIADSPFDTLMNYAVNECGSDATEEQILDYLDQLESRRLNLMFSLKDYFGPCNATNRNCNNPLALEDIVATVSHKVTAFASHPAIIGWYLNDEACPACLPELVAGYDKIVELDNNHPVWSVHWNPNWLLEEAHTTDIVGVDPYPIYGKPDDNITLVSWMADQANKSAKPLWLVPQIFDWSDYGREARPPTKEEMRAMTYLAVNHGAKGLIYYSYFNIRDDDDYEIRWPQIKEIASEIDQLRRPPTAVLLSTHQTNQNDIVCDNDNIDFKLMRENNTYYLSAVNTKEETFANVSFQIAMELKSAVVDVLFEENGVGIRQVPVENGDIAYITDDFGPYEVHVYNWEAAPDKDGDGFDSAEEWGPDGSDRNYDGDGDGKPDGEYANTASGPTYGDQHYVTIAVPDAAALSDCQVLDNPYPDNPPARREFPFGFFGFEVTGLQAQEDCTAVTIVLPQNAEISEYWRYGPTVSHRSDHWYEFMYDRETGAEIFHEDTRTRIVLHLCDGMRGDDDLDANGTIVDAGGPAVVVTSGGGGGGGGSCFISTSTQV